MSHKAEEKDEIELIEAVKQGDKYTVLGLLNSGHNVNQKDSSGKTALMYALDRGSSHSTLLLRYGANVNIVDSKGRNALLYMSNRKLLEYSSIHKPLLRQMLFLGVEVNKADLMGRNILMYLSLREDSIDAIHTLIEYKCDVLHRDNQGKSLMYYAIVNNNLGVIRALLNHSKVEDFKDEETKE